MLACAPTMASPAMADWFWALPGGVDPTTVPTSEGNVGWTYSHDSFSYWEPVTTVAPDTALRFVDNSTTGQPRFDTNSDGIKDDVSSGFTLAFRIKAESASFTTPIMQFVNHLSGATTKNRLKLSIEVNGAELWLKNTDTSALYGRIDDGWHTFWSMHTVEPDGSVRYRIVFDGTEVDNYTRTNTSATAARFGFDASTYTGSYQLDYLAYALDGAYEPGTLPIPMVPEPASIVLLSLGLGLMGRMRSGFRRQRLRALRTACETGNPVGR